MLQTEVYISIFTLKLFLLSLFPDPLHFPQSLKCLLTAVETTFRRVSYLLSQIRLTHVGFLERHTCRNVLVSVTHSG